VKTTEQPIDTSTAAGMSFLDMSGVFAEFETNLRKDRQHEGIAKANAGGVTRTASFNRSARSLRYKQKETFTRKGFSRLRMLQRIAVAAHRECSMPFKTIGFR
jgi:DNA invertase Pin-like site-specific DNA recombinase